MEKFKFITEYELRVSPKVLFPYISTASGLSEWFCQKVNALSDHKFDFVWDKESHIAKQTSLRLNKSIKFEFINTSDDPHDNNFVELKIEVSDLSNTTYLKITDYSATTDEEELEDLWGSMIDRLKEIVGS